jgi:predicted outer membrane protein
MQMGRLAGWLALALVGVVGCGRPDGEDGAVTEPFGDNRVLGLALALTDHQVIIAEAALSRPLSIPAVQDYAMRLAAEQRQAGDRLRALGMEQGLFVDQATTEAEAHIEDTKVDIRSMQDAPEYIADSAHDVRKAVRVFDNTLLVKVNNAALRAELEVIRALLAADLAQAQQIERDNGVPPKPD